MSKKILPLFLSLLFVFASFFIYTIIKHQYSEIKTTILSSENFTNIIQTTKPMPDIFYAPVLVYHHIAPNPNNSQHYVSPEIFEQQMGWLKNNNYNVITYKQLYEALTASSTLPTNPVVITFDDGNKDQYENAFPILKKYNYTAMFFIETITIGKSQWMSFDMMRELLDAGMEIGSHTVTHYNLPKQNLDTIKSELTKSKQVLEENLNIPIDFFAYPNGTYSQLIIEELMTAGYKSATTITQSVLQDKNKSIYLIPRLYITDNLKAFIAKIKQVN